MNSLGFKLLFFAIFFTGHKTLKIHPFSCFIYFISRFPNKKNCHMSSHNKNKAVRAYFSRIDVYWMQTIKSKDKQSD